MLEIRSLEFWYKSGRPVLKDISLELEHGGIACLLGPNGTGKTTLLRCLLGLNKPKKGEILLDGQNLEQVPMRKRASLMAYVPQSSSIAFAYDVREIVMMGRVSHLAPGASHTEADKKAVMECLEKLQIADLAERRFMELSGGERQMVLVARAMAQQARYLIMDEPTANLDYSNQIKILRTIKELAKSGYGVLMTSHYPDHAFLACTEAVLMRGGHILFRGTPDEVVTTQTLSELYSAPVAVSTTEIDGSPVKVCVPVLS